MSKTHTINTILIANRGEIASRVIRTCRKMGIRSVAVFSEADKDLPYVGEADVAVHIGAASPAESYLNQEKIIKVAKQNGADAIHPGYGFLSENAGFAERCAAAGIIFIGPNIQAIKAMGSKSEAKNLMQQHDVPTIPGYQGSDQSNERLRKEATEMGFPVLLKATAGGGGKGMRIVRKASEINAAIEAAKREAQNAFGDDEMIIEKYIESGRHIEFQIFGDQHGNAIHIMERECSIQRRYQKVIEESPSPIMNDKLRNEMGASAVAAAKALNYDNAGTVEFIFDDKSGKYYFLEVNTRLQVEHPVTEEITGLDLVQMQIESAMGLPLRVSQTDVQARGYAIEVRLYAEDAENDFLPVSGTISRFEVPQVEGLRVETAIQSGSQISMYYDPMIAKLIVWDAHRATALRKMRYVLRNLVCLGMTTNQDFLIHLLEHPDFEVGKYDTHFIEQKIDLNKLTENKATHAATAALACTIFNWYLREKNRTQLKSIPSGWRNNFYEHQRDIYHFNDEKIEIKYRSQYDEFECLINEEKHVVKFILCDNSTLSIEIDGQQQQFHIVKDKYNHFVHNESFGNVNLVLQERLPRKEAERVPGEYLAPMPSQVIKILVEAGAKVEAGQGLIVLSSMKMENTICAEEDGKVAEIYVAENTNIEAGTVLLKLDT